MSAAARLTRTLARKVVVVLLALAALVVLLVCARATWLSGPVDGVAGPTQVLASGDDAAPGLVALGLTGLAASIAAVTGGRLVRWISLVALVGAALTVLALIVRAVGDGDAILGGVAARSAGSTGTFEAVSSLAPWPWVALLAPLLLVLAALGVALGGRSWGALSGRYEGAGGPEVAGGRGERVGSDWDRVSRGEDPTSSPDQAG